VVSRKHGRFVSYVTVDARTLKEATKEARAYVCGSKGRYSASVPAVRLPVRNDRRSHRVRAWQSTTNHNGKRQVMCGLASAVTGDNFPRGKFAARHPYAVGGGIGALVVAVLMAVTVWATSGYDTGVFDGNNSMRACHATQPVYAGTDNVGTWDVTLRLGERVTLPDGDTATCTPHGLDVS
jgi:hypothetical protein